MTASPSGIQEQSTVELFVSTLVSVSTTTDTTTTTSNVPGYMNVSLVLQLGYATPAGGDGGASPPLATTTTPAPSMPSGATSETFPKTNSSSTTTVVTSPVSIRSPSVQNLATLPQFYFSNNVALVPYAPNSSYNGTLVVFSGQSGTTSSPIQFYCCLGAEYAEPIPVSDGRFDMVKVYREPTTEKTTTPSLFDHSGSISSSIHSGNSRTSTALFSTSKESHTATTSGTSSHDHQEPQRRNTTTRHQGIKKIERSYHRSHTNAATGVTSSMSWSISAGSFPSVGSSSHSRTGTASTTPPVSWIDAAAATMSHTVPPPPLAPPSSAVSPQARLGIGAMTSVGSLAGPVATALATMGLAERCLIPLRNETKGPLSFPQSVIPIWRIGNSTEEYPRLPYYRGAAVASLVVHGGVAVVAALVMLGMAIGGITERQKWQVDVALRIPLAIVLCVGSLALDGGVGGGATAVHMSGTSELGYLFCGLLGPVTSIVVVVVLTFSRRSAYDAKWLLEGAPLKKRQALLATRGTPLGFLHRYVVGVGSWRGVEGVRRLALAAYGKYRGPGLTSSPWRSKMSAYFFTFITTANIVMSGARAIASANACVASCAIVAVVCTLMTVLYVVIRPMTSVVKNVVAIFLSGYATVNAWLLLGAAAQGSTLLYQAALTMAVWQAFLSGANAILTSVSMCLSLWASKSGRSHRSSSLHRGATKTTDTNTTTIEALLMDPDDLLRSDDDDDDDDKDSKDNAGKELDVVAANGGRGGGGALDALLLVGLDDDNDEEEDDVTGEGNTTIMAMNRRPAVKPNLTRVTLPAPFLPTGDDRRVGDAAMGHARPEMPLTELEDIRR